MAESSVIGPTTVVRGNVRGDGSIEIYGQVDGDVIVTGDVALGENANVRGDVRGARVSIGGIVAGDLSGTEAIVLERTAQVTGDISAPRIGMEEGARVRGALRTEEPSGPAGRTVEARRPAPRAHEVPRQSESRAEPPRAAAPRPAPRPEPAAQKKAPPAPVVPALRGLHGRKKKARGG